MTPAGVSIWCLVALAVAIALAGVWVFNHPEIVAKGQDAAGKGMLTGCLGFLLLCITAVLGIVAAVIAVVKRAELGWGTEAIAWLPLFGLAAAGLTIQVLVKVNQVRQEEAHQAKLARIPVFLLVEADDNHLQPMYHALRRHYEHVQMQQFYSPVALHWQQHWLPRAKLIAIQADATVAGKDARPETAELVEDILYMHPAANVIFHAADPKDAEGYAAKLKHARVVSTSEPDWIETRWLPVALEMLAPYPELKQKQPDELDVM
jgi:hypothetical protein